MSEAFLTLLVATLFMAILITLFLCWYTRLPASWKNLEFDEN